MREFLSSPGAAQKFWRIGHRDGEVTVEFGRVGARGQTLIKNYDTSERGEREVVKLIEEKLRKGYREAASV